MTEECLQLTDLPLLSNDSNDVTILNNVCDVMMLNDVTKDVVFDDVVSELDNNFIINTLKELRRDAETQLLSIQTDTDPSEELVALIKDLADCQYLQPPINNKRGPESPESSEKRVHSESPPQTPQNESQIQNESQPYSESPPQTESTPQTDTPRSRSYRRGVLGHNINIGDVTNATADSIVPPGTKPLVFNKKDLLPDKLRSWKEGVVPRNCTLCNKYLSRMKNSTKIAHLGGHIAESGLCPVCGVGQGSTEHLLTHQVEGSSVISDLIQYIGDKADKPNYTPDTSQNKVVSTPACVATVPIAKFKYKGESGDKLIMEGLVQTGDTQTNCFLIPITLSPEDLNSIGTNNEIKDEAITNKINQAISVIAGGISRCTDQISSNQSLQQSEGLQHIESSANQNELNTQELSAEALSSELSSTLTEALEKLSNDELLQLLHNYTSAEPTAQCNVCEKEFTSPTALNTHMSTHLITHRYSCFECGFGTGTIEELLVHKAGHGGELEALGNNEQPVASSSKCDPVALPLDASLLETPAGYRKCYICNSAIPDKQFIEHLVHHRHQLTVKSSSKKAATVCTMCGVCIGEKEQLSPHLASHVTTSGYKCAYCHLPFTDLISLRQHTSLNHSDPSKKTFQCYQCPSNFSGTYHLKRHIKTMHDNKRDYKCPDCSKSFVEQHCLKRHIRNVHKNVRDHTCPICSRGFTYRQDMFRHIMSVHQKVRDVTCPVCNKSFYHRYFINHALRVHDLTVKQRDGIFYVYDEQGKVVHKIS